MPLRKVVSCIADGIAHAGWYSGRRHRRAVRFLHGPRKFQDFEASLAGISPNTLSARLKRLEEADVVERRMYAEHPPRAEYVLTAKGRELGPVLKSLCPVRGHRYLKESIKKNAHPTRAYFGPATILNLYRIAHSESMVDKWELA